ncbi:ROK family protein [Anaerolineales bacterium]
MQILGIDIGGSGIKGALVDCEQGIFLGDRFRLDTPAGAEPEAVAAVVSEIVKYFDWQGPIGCTFPAIIKNGVAHSAANVSDQWIGTNVAELIASSTANQVKVINDADAAGIAEMRFGNGQDRKGVTILLTIGTGIGSAMFIDQYLLPNSELGHLEIRGKDAEKRASDQTRKRKDLSWQDWGARLNEYLSHVEFLFSPDLMILGGGVSKKFSLYSPYLSLQTEIIPAKLLNDAGIIGAALVASTL